MKKTKKINAFTILELLVVLAIIGILAALAYPNYKKHILKARLTNMAQVAEAVKTEILDKYISTGRFPNNPNFFNNVNSPAIRGIEFINDRDRLGFKVLGNNEYFGIPNDVDASINYIYPAVDNSLTFNWVVECRDFIQQSGLSVCGVLAAR
jgi:prepilin-type N-terminal cleavage/methylation domain-containing protein